MAFCFGTSSLFSRLISPTSVALRASLCSLILCPVICWPGLALSSEQSPLLPRISTITFQGDTNSQSFPSIPLQSDFSANQPAITQPALTQPALTQQRNTLNFINSGFFIFDVSISLTFDNDQDGHYSSFSVSLDVDSSFPSRSVYAVMYLSQNNGPLFEYAVTGNFTVSGSGPFDTVFIETDLDSGYPSGFYDHHIEIYDARDDTLLQTFGPEQSNNLRRLPIESFQNDTIFTTVGVASGGVSLSFSGSGSAGQVFLSGLFLLVLFRRFRRTTC